MDADAGSPVRARRARMGDHRQPRAAGKRQAGEYHRHDAGREQPRGYAVRDELRGRRGLHDHDDVLHVHDLSGRYRDGRDPGHDLDGLPGL